MRSASDGTLPESAAAADGWEVRRAGRAADGVARSGFGLSRAHGALLGVCAAVFLVGNPHWEPAAGSGAWRFAPARAVSGDEPHYLVMIHSLLADGDLNVGSQYRRAAAGGPEAGRRFRGRAVDHHTIIVDPDSDRSELWQRVYDPRSPQTCSEIDCVPYERIADSPGVRSPSAYQRPAHAVGSPLLAALFVASFRATPDAVEAPSPASPFSSR